MSKSTKRKSEATSEASSQQKRKKQTSAELRAYFTNYKKGTGDFHWPIFTALQKIVKAKYVLYPGCHRHVTASLMFPNVVYVDNYSKVEGVFTDQKVLEWINENKEYTDETKIKFLKKNFEQDFGEKPESFDLVMSLSAGIVTTSCSKYVKKDGYFFVSDAHYDARMLNLDKDFILTHVWENEGTHFDGPGTFNDSAEALSGYFVTKKGENLTKEMVQESIHKPKAKRSFKLQKDAMFFLFKRIK